MIICTRCKQVITQVVTIKGKPYGTTCAETILGIRAFPSWFRGGDWDKAREEHDKSEADRMITYNVRIESMRNSWAFIHSLSVAFRRARISENDFEIKFLADMALKHGFQLSKETAYKYDSFEEFHETEGKLRHGDHIETPTCFVPTEKQQNLLNRLL